MSTKGVNKTDTLRIAALRKAEEASRIGDNETARRYISKARHLGSLLTTKTTTS